MPIPDYQTLMLPVLKAAASGPIRITDAIETLAGQLNLSEEDREELLPSGRQTKFANRVHWAKTYLKQAGLLTTPKRAYFQLTERGTEALQLNLQRIDNRYLSQFSEFHLFKARVRSEKSDHIPISIAVSVESATPDEVLRNAHKEIQDQLGIELLDRIVGAPAQFFERLVVSLLLAMGYGGSVKEAGRALGKSHDGGVDGVIDQDILGLDRVYVQAKRYAAGNNVGSAAIRDFFGSLDRFKAAKGLFVTTSAFTQDAEETARFLSKRIVLIDGAKLTQLMMRYNVGCRTEEVLELKRVDEEFFEDDI